MAATKQKLKVCQLSEEAFSLTTTRQVIDPIQGRWDTLQTTKTSNSSVSKLHHNYSLCMNKLLNHRNLTTPLKGLALQIDHLSITTLHRVLPQIHKIPQNVLIANEMSTARRNPSFMMAVKLPTLSTPQRKQEVVRGLQCCCRQRPPSFADIIAFC